MSESFISRTIVAQGRNIFGYISRIRLRAGGQFIRDWLLNYSGVVIPTLTAILLIPIMARALGSESYGLWITATSVASLLGILDLGFGAAVARETGIARGTSIDVETQQFIRSVGNLVILLALGCAGAMALAAIPLSKTLHLSLSLQKITPLIFGLYGLAFFGDWLFDYSRSILIGLGRFGLVALLSTSGAITRAVGVVVLLNFSNSLVQVASWWAACQLITAFVALFLVGHIEPPYSFHPGWPNWQSLLSRTPFSLGMVLCNSLYNFIWQIPLLAISFLLGPSALVPYFIGQKFPVGSLGFVHSGGEVLYISSSMASSSEDMQSEALVLRSALRWNFLIVLPLLIVFVIFSPALFPIWIRVSSASLVEVARIVALAALVDTICAPLLNSLWGRGLIRQTLVALALGTAICGMTDLLLIPHYGLTSAAVGLLLGSLILAVHLIWTTSRFFGIGPLGILADLRVFIIPGILCAVAGYTSMYCLKPAHWVSLIFATLPAWIVFFASFYVMGSSVEDRKKIHDLVRSEDETPGQLYCSSDRHAN